MRCVVIYSSQTGNTEKIAYAIHTGVKQITGHCDILKIKEANPKRLYEYDLIGIGGATHHFRESANVTAFVKDIRFVGGKHSFAFSTHGTLPANFFARLVPALKERGLIVIGWDDWYAADLAHGGFHPCDGHPDEIDLKEAAEFGRGMVSRSVRISAGETNLIPEVPAVDARFVPSPTLMKPILQQSKRLKWEKEKCLYPACRLCMDNCPMDGWDLTVNPPVIAKPCMQCGPFCELICPTGAIVYDHRIPGIPGPRQTKQLEKLGHPDGLAALREAEAAGRFRRLVTEKESIAARGTFRWKDTNKHPRWIIGKGYNV